jgi:hypothetical protein
MPMTNERTAAIEQTITQLEATAKYLTNQMIYTHIVGNYAETAQYLKQRRLAGPAPASGRRADREPAPRRELTPVEQHAAGKRNHKRAMSRRRP